MSCWIISQELKEFQSTLPRGSDIALSSNISSVNEFQSTLPRGSDDNLCPSNLLHCIISIHAPSRERLKTFSMRSQNSIFQSTLPRGSDSFEHFVTSFVQRFQSTLPRGSDYKPNLGALAISYFNPRSLAGATILGIFYPNSCNISIHAPSRERQHQNKLLLYSFKSSIFCELAQLKYSKIYFDVRKLIVSHSSLSCEPKLNFMFHITSHRIILHYFYSCQSICK